ncbi:hypothetical protein SBOR_4446 [Sclerotinia borealis F-4128]|uniref:Uncharacterized protein n=1 Tax=Sclerotinia borealis (strain F-4128) TaxID=1432307 RepID=W9CGZ6_SCLBF|nr:hypothetical protein SBOR_4446 [Sclerotinia borealis F-4128]
MGSPDYAPLPRESSDSERYIYSTPDEYRTSLGDTLRTPKSRSITINYVLILRLINLSLAIPSFIIFVRDGFEQYIAADIFLMLIMIFNTVRILHLFVSSVFQVTVEVSRGAWQSKLSVQPNGARATNVMDCILASGLGFAMIGGLVNYWRNSQLVAGIVLAFFTMAIQYIIALPIKNQTFMLKFHYYNKSEGNGESGEGLQPHNDEVIRAIPRDEPYRQTPEDLV